MYGYRLGAIGIVITFFAIIFSTVLMPMVLFNPKASGHGNDYDAQHEGNALRGRQIYVREGCFYCHTQFNRLQDRGYGPLVKAGDYTFETPHQLGTARTGPDLTNEGGRFPEQWQKAHLVEPRAVKPGSIMPSFSYLNDRDMNDLVSYIETLGNGRKSTAFVEAPDEYRTTTETGRKLIAFKTVDTKADASANAGRGIYQQNCASCHGLDGRGDGPNAISLEKKPPNLTRPFYKQYPDEFWFYRITEGVPGTRMPRWGDGGSLGDPRSGILTHEQRWYLVAYLKTLPKDKEETIDNIDQLNRVEQTPLPVLTHQEYEPPTGDE
ncbi:MAG TPA: cbb3-type cytochrome c oxidase subunit II [Trichormus sp.]|jgi:cbb3-type cytochrome oxidase cytochrome c subunit